MGFFSNLGRAVFLDIPSVIDSVWRHIDIYVNAEARYEYEKECPLRHRPFWHKPPFWFFAITLLFVSYGPTWDGLCAIGSKPVTDFFGQGLGIGIIVASLLFALLTAGPLRDLVNRHVPPPRRRMVRVAAAVALVAVTSIGIWGVGERLLEPSDTPCGVQNGDGHAQLRLLLCVAAIGLFGVTGWIWSTRLNVVLWAQALILAAVAIIQWRLLTPPHSNEASDLPYRHIFQVWAPCIVALLILAPLMVKLAFGAGAGLSQDTCKRFRCLLKQRELFVVPPRPDESPRRILYAIVYGPAYHPLALLLLPALVALAAPAKTLYPWVIGITILSCFLLVWGNVSSRWQQLNTQIERWFLRGTPLLVSLFVILVGVLRVFQVDYVSTILDAAPFGFVFGLVAMNYVLFWLMEYWMSRAAAEKLLQVLRPPPQPGALPPDPIAIRYEPRFTEPQAGVRVVRQQRMLVLHDTGRFIAMGAIGDYGSDLENQPSVPDKHPAEPAFQSYFLTELFARLGENTHDPQDHEAVTEITQRSGMYFFLMNLMIAAVSIAFVGFFAYEQYFANNAIEPVVHARAGSAQHTVDLKQLLTPEAGKPLRPAIVVVGSGGGTRAALYTASVLNGLHKLGVDGDVVLVSGVSGGGAALAYFSARHDALKGPNATAEWEDFTKRVTKPFITDVLNGASEWRLYRRTALSELLVESFDRYLVPRRFDIGSVNGLAFILNSAIVSHPADDSDVLNGTLENTQECDEAERTYKMMGGGRLIFTNLRNVDKFPGRASRVPDVRLPYQIVRDSDVSLAAAATLNANFPPVFPNARVQISSNDAQKACSRSYYATDGGTEENLGLVSALYALKSALTGIRNTSVRPIHVVIAEASAVSYDYGQDRGVSALLGSKERLTGGLTSELIDDVERELTRAVGADSQIDFHYLALPLAFRARGGFGTHWMYAQEYHLSDPRPRTVPWYHFLPDWLLDSKATVHPQDLEALWRALHDPDKPFCAADLSGETLDARKVQTWICGSDRKGRDLHMAEWQRLIDAMTPYRTP